MHCHRDSTDREAQLDLRRLFCKALTDAGICVACPKLNAMMDNSKQTGARRLSRVMVVCWCL
jgi:hypothetical protein